MDTARCWPQEIGLVKTVEETMMVSTTPAAAAAAAAVSNTASNPNLGAINTTQRAPQLMERRARPQKEQALNCPRCNSTNTKFCYYNNYSLTQPRYFCKTCRRYWTEGGSLRNVPVGGGSRKNKRSSSSSSNSASTASSAAATTTCTTTSMRLNPSSPSSSQNPKFHEGQDLNLSFPQIPCLDSPTNPNAVSAMEFLRSTRALPPFLPMPPVAMAETGTGAVYPPGFELHDHHQLRPPVAFGFPLENNTSNYGGMQENINNSAATGRMLFPFEDLRQIPTTTNTANAAEFKQDTRSGQQGAGDQPGTFWNHMMGGGTSW